MSNIGFQPTSVMTDGGAQDGRLVFFEGHLIAVFTIVSADDTVGDEANRSGWFLEAGFGPCSPLVTIAPPVFETFESAADWVAERVASRRI